jgi:transaldolase
MINPLQGMISLGQSPWYDNIERGLLTNGQMAEMIARGDIRGVTSNPSIFHHAIAHSTDYDFDLSRLAKLGKSTQEIYEQLVIQDIQAAADLFRSMYEQTQGNDGYVSLEVNPLLAKDTDATLKEALRLWQAVDRKNLMIKIPATAEGLPAIRKAIAAGLNINVTLIFSLSRYGEVMEAYLAGLEDRFAAKQSLRQIASVASFFVSRLDTKVDNRLKSIVSADPSKQPVVDSLVGKLAVANTKLAYFQFRQVFSSQRFLVLKNMGARLQRPLWASTSTKNPAYPDTLYVDNLVGPDSVNTMPPQTLAAYKDHGMVGITIDKDMDQARRTFTELSSLGISMDEVTNELEFEGVKAFAEAFTSLIQTIEERRLRFLAET